MSSQWRMKLKMIGQKCFGILHHVPKKTDHGREDRKKTMEEAKTILVEITQEKEDQSEKDLED